MREPAPLCRWLLPAALGAVLAALCLWPGALAGVMGILFPGETELLYPRASLSFLVVEHLALTLASSALAAAVGIGLAVAATRRRGGSLSALADRFAAMAQTFPPAAVLALSVPALGFGFRPTVAALFLYSVLPILRNTVEGLEGVPAEAMDAARGMGMGARERLRLVEIPLAAPAILAGLRTAIVVNIGTATIGATIGAGGLGAPIISGLVTERPSYLAEGALAVGLLALAADGLFGALMPRKPEDALVRRGARG
jgi:osmoprotectant transport system permease protein